MSVQLWCIFIIIDHLWPFLFFFVNKNSHFSASFYREICYNLHCLVYPEVLSVVERKSDTKLNKSA